MFLKVSKLCSAVCSSSCSCRASEVFSTRRTASKRGSVSFWAELRWSTWRGWDQCGPLQNTTECSALSTRNYCPRGSTCTPVACMASPWCWRSKKTHPQTPHKSWGGGGLGQLLPSFRLKSVEIRFDLR